VNLSCNGAVAPNTSVGFGYQATYSGSNASPTAFTLSGRARAIG